MKRVLLVGGASGGHAMPLLAVGEAVERQTKATNQTVELFFLGIGDYLAEPVRAAGWNFRSLLAGKVRTYFSPQIPVDYLKMFLGFFHALWRVFWIMPDAVFAKGGYDTVWPVFWAKLFAIPVYLHESDAIPGRANRLLARFADHIFLAFAGAASYFPGKTTMVVGNPVRSAVLQGGDRASALTAFKFSNLPTVLVLGGSQGAANINNLILVALAEMTKSWQVIHQTGVNNFAKVDELVKRQIKEGSESYGQIIQARYRSVAFLNEAELAQAYAAADVIVARGGAALLFEIAALGKPAIIIPIKNSASNHQYANAVEFAKFGGVLLEEDNLTPHILLNELRKAYAQRLEISQKIKAFAPTDAADKIAEQILKS